MFRDELRMSAVKQMILVKLVKIVKCCETNDTAKMNDITHVERAY